MSAFLQTLLEMTLTGSWMILAVMVLRLLLRRAPKRVRCAMWAIAGLRLALPFRLPVGLRLLPRPWESAPAVSPAAPSTVAGAPATAPVEVAAPPPDVWGVFFYIWLGGVLALLIYLTAGTVRLRLSLRESVPSTRFHSKHARVKECDRLHSAFVMGVLRPVVYLPSGLDKRHGKYILMHEEAHVSRLDHLRKPLGFLILTAHWFNPLCWVAYHLFEKDMELACDERVFHGMKLWKRKEYCRVLLDMSAPAHAVAACPFAFGENPVKQRIKFALNYRKPQQSAAVLSAILCAALAVLCAVGPAAAKSNDAPAPAVQTEPVPVVPQLPHEESMAAKQAAARAADVTEPPTEPPTEKATEAPTQAPLETEVQQEAIYDDSYDTTYAHSSGAGSSASYDYDTLSMSESELTEKLAKSIEKDWEDWYRKQGIEPSGLVQSNNTYSYQLLNNAAYGGSLTPDPYAYAGTSGNYAGGAVAWDIAP